MHDIRPLIRIDNLGEVFLRGIRLQPLLQKKLILTDELLSNRRNSVMQVTSRLFGDDVYKPVNPKLVGAYPK